MVIEPQGDLVVRCVAASRRAARHRNEDAIALSGWHLHGDSDLVLDVTVRARRNAPLRWAVSDGMGGRPAGDIAAQRAAVVLTTAPLARATSADHAEVRLRSLFEAADAAVRAAATDTTRGLGCTVAYIEMAADGETVVANVGDVRVYQMLNGYLGLLTVDDRPAPTAGAAPGRVLRCLGGDRLDDVTPHRFPLRLQVGDVLVAMTDGVHDCVTSETIEAAIVDDVAASVENVIAAAVEQGASDNMTVVAIEVLGTA